MKKVLLAVGHRQLEEYLESQLSREFIFVGTTVYREGVVRAVGQKAPDIVIIRETLNGTENIMSVIYEIRSKYPNIRIIFLAGNREPGDELLATLVNYGIYDILNGENIQAQKIVSLVRIPNTYNDVRHFQPVPLLDEERNKMLFEAPDSVHRGVEIIEVVRDVRVSEEIPSNNSTTNNDLQNQNKSQSNKNDSKSNESLLNKIKVPQIQKRKKEESISQEITGIVGVTSEKIITFIGGKSGVGSTSIAINTAFTLAGRGNKVIYVEFNEKYPAVSYWYELGYTSKGIDTCIDAIIERDFKEIGKSIIKSVDLKKEKTAMQKNYKKFPDSLDFMFFSKEYLSRLKDRIKIEKSKELFLYLMYQLGYDFVIIDVSSDIEDEATQNGLMFSNKVFSVITQDVSSVGYHLFNLNNLEKMGIDISSKSNFILNKYVKSNFSEKDIKEWMEIDELLTISDYSEDFINANLEGIPVVINSKNPELLGSINNIVNVIMSK